MALCPVCSFHRSTRNRPFLYLHVLIDFSPCHFMFMQILRPLWNFDEPETHKSPIIRIYKAMVSRLNNMCIYTYNII